MQNTIHKYRQAVALEWNKRYPSKVTSAILPWSSVDRAIRLQVRVEMGKRIRGKNVWTTEVSCSFRSLRVWVGELFMLDDGLQSILRHACFSEQKWFIRLKAAWICIIFTCFYMFVSSLGCHLFARQSESGSRTCQLLGTFLASF